MRLRLRAIIRVSLCALGVAVLCLGMLPTGRAEAALLEARSITLGSPTSGATTSHTFRFTYASSGTVGSVVFEYCDSPLSDVPCVIPPGLDVSGASLTQQQGETGFSVFSATPNQLTLARAPTAVSYTHLTLPTIYSV